MTTHEDVEQSLKRALQELLAGSAPSETDLQPLTGEAKACIDALQEALNATGVEGVRKAFTALVKDRPWLGKLVSDPAQEPEPEKPERRIRFMPLSEFFKRPSQQWIIPEILPRDGLALVYGESGGYKTFLVLDWSFCVATGTPWLGRRVTQGSVAYILAEGSYGIKKRAQAWLVHHQRFFDDDEILNQQVPLRLYDKSIMLQDLSQIDELRTALEEDFPQGAPLLVVIDTLSRCSPGAEEVSNTDMARVLASADLVREQFHCTVLIVHHEGKDKERGPRGASALLANIETALSVTPNSRGTKLESIKAKDAPRFNPIRLEAQEVRFGPLPDDASLVLIPITGGDEDEDKPRLTDTEARMYALLVKAGRKLPYTEWLNAGKEEHLNERLASEAVSSLKKAGLVQQPKKRGPYSIVQDHLSPDPDPDPDGEPLP